MRNLASAAMYFPCKLLLTFSQLDSLEQINMANTKYIQCSSKYCCFFFTVLCILFGKAKLESKSDIDEVQKNRHHILFTWSPSKITLQFFISSPFRVDVLPDSKVVFQKAHLSQELSMADSVCPAKGRVNVTFECSP